MSPRWAPQLQKLLGSLSADFNVQELELPESPVFIAVAMPTSVETTGLRPRLPAGRGLSAAQAVLSAAAEGVELLASLAQNCDRVRNRFILRDGQTLVLARNLNDGPDDYIAAQRVYLDWAGVFNETLVHDADSNGCASGATLDDALARATLECIERDAMAIWWYGRQRRRHLSITCLDRRAPRLSWWLNERKRHVMFIDVSSDVGVPVVAAVSHDESGSCVAMGSAAAIDIEGAAISAATEMIQMEASMTMGSKSVELQNWLAKASVFEMPQFHPNHDLPENSFGVVDLQRQLDAAGHKSFAVDLTRPQDLLATARVIVPTLSALHRAPDHGRIISHSRQQPQFGGIQSLAEMEKLEPY